MTGEGPSASVVPRLATPERSARSGRRGAWPWAVALVVAAGAGTLFGGWAFGTPHVDEAAAAPATVNVTEMSVGHSVPLAVSATWTARPFGVGAASGVLTSLDVVDGGTVDTGDPLFTVDLRPVVAAVGDVPAFRDLSRGSRGDDVTQVQQFLIASGYLSEPADGNFGGSTAQAVRAWQESLGVDKDGVVRAGDIVFASRLPARVQVADDVAVGMRMVAGDALLLVLDGEPEFVATILQGANVDPSLPIEVIFDDEAVTTVVARSRNDESGTTMWTLTREDGASVCADRCDQVPLDQRNAVFTAHQVVDPEITGPGVPAAAVWFTAAGDPYVVQPDGSQIPVTIVGQGQGGVVLEGVAEGTVVMLADESAAATP